MSLEALKNLDPNSIYKVIKVTVKDDTQIRMVDKGFEMVGQVEVVPNQNEENMYHLVVGRWELITSPLVSASQNGDNFVVETKNSMYTLEKLD